jgi:hypothetical protein
VDGIARRTVAVVLAVELVERGANRDQNVVIGSPARHMGHSAAG